MLNANSKMKPLIIKKDDNYFLSWNDELIRILTSSQDNSRHYGGATYIIEFDNQFNYEAFKHLTGQELPDNSYISSDCRISSYKPVSFLHITKINNSISYNLVISFFMGEWKENVHLNKFCEKLWESFTLSGFITESKPEMEEHVYCHIPVTIFQPLNKRIQDVVEEACALLNEIHLSVFKKLCIEKAKIKR